MVLFVKAHGLGNDFVIIKKLDTFLITPLLIRKIADRKRGVGCDQVIFYSYSTDQTYEVSFFNADGSEAEACGNGTRALALLLFREGASASKVLNFKVKNNSLKVKQLSQTQIEVELENPKFHWQEIPQAKDNLMELPIQEGQISPYYAVNIGNPHLIAFVENLDHIDLAKIGPVLESHSLFPQRINVTFAEIISSHQLKIAVWERGSGLTEACGTAACAATVVAIEEGIAKGPVMVSQKGGELAIDWNKGPIKMAGVAVISYRGELDLSSL